MPSSVLDNEKLRLIKAAIRQAESENRSCKDVDFNLCAVSRRAIRLRTKQGVLVATINRHGNYIEESSPVLASEGNSVNDPYLSKGQLPPRDPVYEWIYERLASHGHAAPEAPSLEHLIYDFLSLHRKDLSPLEQKEVDFLIKTNRKDKCTEEVQEANEGQVNHRPEPNWTYWKKWVLAHQDWPQFKNSKKSDYRRREFAFLTYINSDNGITFLKSLNRFTPNRMA